MGAVLVMTTLTFLILQLELVSVVNFLLQCAAVLEL